MATARKTKKDQPPQPPQSPLQEDNYLDNSADEYTDDGYKTDIYELSGDDTYLKPQRPIQRQSRRQRQQHTRQDAVEETDNGGSYSSDEYNNGDEDKALRGKAMQAYKPDTQSITNHGSMDVASEPKRQEGIDKDEDGGIELNLELDLDIEDVELNIYTRGDWTLTLT